MKRSPGPYTGGLALMRAARRRTACLTVYIRDLLSQLYFVGARVSDEQLRGFVTPRGADTNGTSSATSRQTPMRGEDLAVDLRVRSAASTDADSP
jgi:hypothetical protein